MGASRFRTFLGLGPDSSRADASFAALLPLPLEKTNSGWPGTRLGPERLLEASEKMETLDLEGDFDFEKIGVATFLPPDLDGNKLDEALDHIEALAQRATEGGLWPLAIGGEQSLTLGMARGLKRAFGPLSILHLGARPDFLDSRDGNRLSHRCVFRRLSEEGFEIAMAGVVEASLEEREALERARICFENEPFRPASFEQIFRSLGPRVYLSIDLGVFGSQVCPGVSHPESCAGLRIETALSLIARLFRERSVVGADICELRPLAGDPRSEVFAAWLARRIIGLAHRHTSTF